MEKKICSFLLFGGMLVLMVAFGTASYAQYGVISKEELIAYTSLWKGERFPDGRPKVPDDILERMKKVKLAEAWSVLTNSGYNNQFEGGWVAVGDKPSLVGRAVTLQFMPLRPDINAAAQSNGNKEGKTAGPALWAVERLIKDDVLVVDMYGKIARGNYGGSNVFTDINKRTGAGVVIDGACRDKDGIMEIPGFTVFCRGLHPASSSERMLTGINNLIRIGMTTVMPGDIVLGGSEGVIFIPAHLAREVVVTSEIIVLREEFGQASMREGKYTAAQIDTRWAKNIEDDFGVWLLKKRGSKLSQEEMGFLHKGQTW
ncbi:MAG: RraA family protein [Candidatus Latescibacterota bacterium]